MNNETTIPWYNFIDHHITSIKQKSRPQQQQQQTKNNLRFNTQHTPIRLHAIRPTVCCASIVNTLQIDPTHINPSYKQ